MLFGYVAGIPMQTPEMHKIAVCGKGMVAAVNPCEINTVVTAVANFLFSSLDRDQFRHLNIFLNELSKTMFSMSMYRDLCDQRDQKLLAEKNAAKKEPPKKQALPRIAKKG